MFPHIAAEIQNVFSKFNTFVEAINPANYAYAAFNRSKDLNLHNYYCLYFSLKS